VVFEKVRNIYFSFNFSFMVISGSNSGAKKWVYSPVSLARIFFWFLG
jgi:hypothetical protein